METTTVNAGDIPIVGERNLSQLLTMDVLGASLAEKCNTRTRWERLAHESCLCHHFSHPASRAPRGQLPWLPFSVDWPTPLYVAPPHVGV